MRKTKGVKFATTERVLPVELEDHEIREHGQKLASLEVQLQTAREDSAADAARWREKKKALSKEIAVETKTVDTGTEERPVVCDMIPDYRANKMDVVRQDTRETIDTRALTPEERQLELAPEKGKKAGKAAKAEGPFIRCQAVDLAPPYGRCKLEDFHSRLHEYDNSDAENLNPEIEAEPPLAPKAKRSPRKRHDNGVQETQSE